MKISVVTICYNNERDIRATIESVINQTYDDIEYIVKDGGSKDLTMEIVNEYKDKITKIISCPDKGIYDGLNQGLQAATGDVVGMIHAGDRLYDNQVIEKIAKFYEENDVDMTYANSVLVNETGKVVRVHKSPEYKPTLMQSGWMPPHESVYVKREVLEKYGYYALDLGGPADYEWCIRYFVKNAQNIKIRLIDEFVEIFSLGGTSSSGFAQNRNERKARYEECWRRNGFNPPTGVVYKKWLSKAKQFVDAWIYNMKH